MIKHLKTVIFTLFCPLLGFAQLSDGEGAVQSIANDKFEIFVPKHFSVSESPSGIIHSASGTFVFIVPVPKAQRTGKGEKMSRDILVDERMSNVLFTEESATTYGRADSEDAQLFNMTYDLEGYTFKRINLIRKHKKDQYLIIGNYHEALTNQIEEEVKKAIRSVRFTY